MVTNMILLNAAYDYSIMISGFSTMVYLYFAFKNSPVPPNSNTIRSVGFKLILNYLIIVILGSVALFTLGYV